MRLRSREIASKARIPNDDGNVDRVSALAEEAADIIDLSDDGSDEAIYIPSDSDHNSSDSEGSGAEVTIDFGLKKRKVKAKGDIRDGQWDFPSSSNPTSTHADHAAASLCLINNPLVPLGHFSEVPPFSDEEEEQTREENSGARKRKFKSGRKKKRDASQTPLLWEVWEEAHENWLDENSKEDVDLDQQNGFVAEVAEAPSELIIPLLRYQKEWLAWASKQEESETRGGILADEMGMGKTIQAISIVLLRRALRDKISALGTSASSSSNVSSGIKTTLVICPVVAVTQWVSEIERFTTEGSVKVLVFHGANRGKNSKKFADYDFVITTYSIVEAEFRKYIMPPKNKCIYCQKAIQQNSMWIHLKYFCGPDAMKTSKQSKQQKKKLKTQQTEDLPESDLDAFNSKSSPKYKGRGRSKKTSTEENDDLDLASAKKKSILHSVNWERIILDEAHFIKDRRCNTAKAVFALDSSYKWALSGTPLQNRVGELYSLVRFLQIVPYSYYLCKDCDCRTLDYGSKKSCAGCEHSSVRHFCWWNKYISNPIQSYGSSYEGRRAMILLKHKVLKNIVLRRTKKGRAADLALPPRIVKLRRDTLGVREEDYYESLYTESQAQFNTYINAGTVMNNYAHIFDLLTRLRQAVDHPYLVVYSATAVQRQENAVDENVVGQVCGVCHDPADDPVVSSCEHVFCKACLLDYSASLGQASCPTCSKPLTVDFTPKTDGDSQPRKTTVKGFRAASILNRIKLNDFQTSTKIEALREEIRDMVKRDGSAKGIVFSQFTSFLDLIHYSLIKSGINCVQLVGSMTLQQRDAAIKKFTDDADCKIFLMSLKAGGVALNLTVASNVFLMDPWWNPAVERQAQDRIHRIGQYKPIRIVRFIIENTVEERILQLQEKKELVFEGTVGGSSEALGKLTEADLRFLFVN
ncbi:ATP-dependent helicase rhp16 [Linum grandiflorum]